MMRLAAFIVLVTLVAVPRTASSQGKRWERQVRAQLDRTVNALQGTSRGGGQTRLLNVGPLNTDESDSIVVELNPGQAYDIVAVCDEDCTGLHLLLSTAKYDVAVDRSSENLPVLHYAPTQAASYRIKVTMAACRVNPCWYGVAIRGS
jgi:hypothetical protein